MHPYAITADNKNEHFGVRACSFAGQLKSPDCAGPWLTVPIQHVKVANPLAPYISVCAFHARTVADALAPPPARRTKRAPAKRDEALSL